MKRILPYSKSRAFSLIELILVMALSVIILGIATQVMFIVFQIKSKAEQYLKISHDARYLYWLFHNNISENRGVESIEQYISQAINNKPIKLLSESKLVNINKAIKAEIITAEQFIEQCKLSAYFQKRIDRSSSILKINYQFVESNKLEHNSIVYYVADTVNKQGKRTKALYGYSHNYSDQLVNDLKIFKVSKKARQYYFRFVFDLDVAQRYQTVEFMVTAM